MEERIEIAPEMVPDSPDEARARPQKKRGWLRHVLWVLLVLFVLFVTVIAFLLGPIAGFAINKFGASALGVDVCSVDSVRIYPFGGYLRVENLVVGKPLETPEAKFSEDLLRLEYFEFDFALRSALSRKKVIDRLELKNLSLTYEQLAGGKSNVGELLARFEEEKGAEAPSSEPEADETPSEPVYIGAHYINIEGVRVRSYFSGVPSMVLPPFSVQFKDGIGLESDLTPVEFGVCCLGKYASLIHVFQDSMIGNAAGAAAGAVSNAAGFTADVVSGAAKETASVVTGVAGATAGVANATVNVVSDVAGATTEAVTETAQKLFNIFSSDEEEDSGNKK